MRELFEIIETTLSENLFAVLGYAAFFMSILFRIGIETYLRKENRLAQKQAVEWAEKYEEAVKKIESISQERQQFMIQIKREREMKGEYKQHVDKILKKVG